MLRHDPAPPFLFPARPGAAVISGKEGIKLTPREALLLLRAARKSTTAEGVGIASRLEEAVRRMRRHQDPRCVSCPERVPELGLACSVACALRIPLKMDTCSSDFAIALRPKPGETWTFNGCDVSITTVDPSGRWFNYIVMRQDGLRFGRIGRTEVGSRAFRKDAGAPTPQKE